MVLTETEVKQLLTLLGLLACSIEQVDFIGNVMINVGLPMLFMT